MLKKYRKFATSSVGFCFLVVGTTGVIFKFFFKSHPLEQIHGWLGIAMVVAALLHITHNWSAIRNYLREARVLALLVPIAIVIGYFSLFGQEESRGGNPRQILQQLAEAPLKDIAKALGKDVQGVMNSMADDGLKVENAEETLQVIAKQNQKSPESLLSYFKHESKL